MYEEEEKSREVLFDWEPVSNFVTRSCSEKKKKGNPCRCVERIAPVKGLPVLTCVCFV